MTKLVMILLFATLNFKAIAQITGSDLFQIIDLYMDEHFDVVLSKLKNQGFELKEATPDYSSKNADYKGDFWMTQPYECQDIIPPYPMHTVYGYIQFKTVSYPSEKEIEVKFEVRMTNAKYFIQDKIEQLRKEIGPEEYLKDEVKSIKVKFQDKKKYYGKDVEDPTSLILIATRSILTFNYWINTYACNAPYSVLTGDLFYKLPKYPVENSDDYFKNLNAYKSTIIVPVKKQGNTYLVEISIGGKNFTYVIDSGASEMLISGSTEKYLLDLGIIRNSDYLTSKVFTLADGSEKSYRRVKLPMVRIGTLKIEDVEAAIVDDNNPMLLGKSFLDKFKYWKINNSNLTLELQH
jgi:clan AA aspartic protease (TIGR02281 family)